MRAFDNSMLTVFRRARTLVVSVALLGFFLIAQAATAVPDTKTLQMRQTSGAVWLWTRLQALREVCSNIPDEQQRFNQLANAASLKLDFSPVAYLNKLIARPAWKDELATDVQSIVKGAGGCETRAMQEWIAGARRLLDTTTQWVTGSSATVWPAPALIAPIRLEIEGLETVDDADPGTLRLSIHNPGQRAVGVALSGKDLRANLCMTFSSPDIPITVNTDVPVQLLTIQPAETKKVTLILDREECFAETEISLWGVFIVVRDSAVEYWAVNQHQVGERRAP